MTFNAKKLQSRTIAKYAVPPSPRATCAAHIPSHQKISNKTASQLPFSVHMVTMRGASHSILLSHFFFAAAFFASTAFFSCASAAYPLLRARRPRPSPCSAPSWPPRGSPSPWQRHQVAGFFGAGLAAGLAVAGLAAAGLAAAGLAAGLAFAGSAFAGGFTVFLPHHLRLLERTMAKQTPCSQQPAFLSP